MRDQNSYSEILENCRDLMEFCAEPFSEVVGDRDQIFYYRRLSRLIHDQNTQFVRILPILDFYLNFFMKFVRWVLVDYL